jgi:hypothetical protein
MQPLTAEQMQAACERLRRIIVEQKPTTTTLVVPTADRAPDVNRRRAEAIGQRTHASDQRGGHRG